MGLEVFDFIPDLVDTNPVGATDFVNEGDDHLRGVKFTLQNQFPNIGQNQMTKTALELNQAAIKTDAINVFNGEITLDALGSSNLLSFDSNGDRSWQLRHNTASGDNFSVRRYVGGVFQDEPILISNAFGFVTFSSSIRTSDGTGGDPSHSFQSEPGMGMFRQGTAVMGFATNGVEQFRVSNANISVLGTVTQFRNLSGQTSVPAYSFNDEHNMGVYRKGIGVLGFATGGVEKLTLEPAVITTGSSIEQIRVGNDGIAGQPIYSFFNQSNMGMFRAGNVLGFSTGGISRLNIINASIQPQVRIENVSGTVALPAFTFTAQSNCGMSLPVANELTFSCGASRQFVVRNNTCAMPLLPLSSAGLASGDLFNQSGFVGIVP